MCITPRLAIVANQIKITGPNNTPILAVPKDCMANKPSKIKQVNGKMIPDKLGIETFTPSIALITEIAGVNIPSPSIRPAPKIPSIKKILVRRVLVCLLSASSTKMPPSPSLSARNNTNKYLMKREDVSPSDIVRRSSATQYGNPPSIDWDALGKVTPVKNQLACGSCWAFATTGMLESRYAIVTNTTGKETLLQLSEQQLLDCSKPYGNMACGGGNIRNSLNYLSNNTTKHVLLSENVYEYIMTYDNDLYAANGAPCRLFSFIEKDPMNVLPENVCGGISRLIGAGTPL